MFTYYAYDKVNRVSEVKVVLQGASFEVLALILTIFSNLKNYGSLQFTCAFLPDNF
jgi:hypothetical protein